MQTELDVRKELVRVCRLLWERGWVANHDGNVTMRLGGGRVLCTPTAFSKDQVTVESLLTVDLEGRKLGGRTRPFSELGLHLRVYQARPDVQVVIHAHPPTATGFALAGAGLDIPAMPEMVVSLGPGIPTVPYAFPGADAEVALLPFLPHHDALLLARHGVLCWGSDAEQAYLRLELVEHVARIELVAYQLGGVPALPREHLERLLRSRTKAGLGPAARSEGQPLPPAPRSAAVRLPGPPQPRELEGGERAPVPRLDPTALARQGAPLGDAMEQIVEEEITRALKQG
ncbi:MAG: class II aldolase/adducin family protein [Myxococcota bacterium]|jgi:L-fuculose-phosphate aldolase|nr:class II aldolase/adducin family protein [Myxococcota bacterium]